jgi:hypothetical protein
MSSVAKEGMGYAELVVGSEESGAGVRTAEVLGKATP